MSDEMHMESAWRHRDMTAIEQWHGPQPDEALMEAEDLSGGVGFPARVEMMDRLNVYLFADGRLGEWEFVAARGYDLMVNFAPSLLVGRGRQEMARLLWVRREQRGEALGEFMEFLRGIPGGAVILARLLGFIFPGTGSRWLFRGTQRAYIMARAWQPWLVTQEGRELSYEDLAEVFEGQELTTPKARNRARSRWSARVQEVLRKPIEAAGGTVRLQFSKSAGAREQMAASARGNQNRKTNAGVLAHADEKTN